MRQAARQTKPGKALLLARSRQIDWHSASHLAALLIDPLRDREVGSSGAVVVGMHGELPVAGPAGEATVEDFAQFVHLVPGDDALLDRVEDASLAFLLDRFPPVGHDEVRAAYRLVIILASSFLEPTAFDQRAVR